MARPHPTPQKHDSPNANPNGAAQQTADLTSMQSHLQKLPPMAANLRRDDDDKRRETTRDDDRRRHDASHANTAPTPRPPTINGNPSLRIREKKIMLDPPKYGLYLFLNCRPFKPLLNYQHGRLWRVLLKLGSKNNCICPPLSALSIHHDTPRLHQQVFLPPMARTHANALATEVMQHRMTQRHHLSKA